MIRVFTLLFPDPAPASIRSSCVLSATTMVVGLIGAVGQRDFRRVLSFNLVGHIGFTTVGLALWTPAALGGSILYILHHMLVITSLFLDQRAVPSAAANDATCARLAACTGRSRPSPVSRWFRCSRWPACLRCRDSSPSLQWSERHSAADQYLARGGGSCGRPADGVVDGAAVG